jgi:hypothetical protein
MRTEAVRVSLNNRARAFAIVVVWLIFAILSAFSIVALLTDWPKFLHRTNPRIIRPLGMFY